MKRYTTHILLLCSMLTLTGCTTYEVNKSLGYIFPAENVYTKSTYTYINTTTTVRSSNGTTTTYTTKGYVR